LLEVLLFSQGLCELHVSLLAGVLCWFLRLRVGTIVGFVSLQSAHHDIVTWEQDLTVATDKKNIQIFPFFTCQGSGNGVNCRNFVVSDELVNDFKAPESSAQPLFSRGDGPRNRRERERFRSCYRMTIEACLASSTAQ